MEQVLADIRAFVAGQMSPAAFRDRLYADESFERYLNADPHLRADNYVKGSVYRFLLQLDLDDPGDMLNAQGALTQFMNRNGIDYKPTGQYEQFVDLIRAAQPGGLDVATKFVQEKMLPDAGGRQGKELKSWLKNEFKKRFRCAKKPPDWIQNPAWPINENGPLVFLGQFELRDYFHDEASVYVFHDPIKGICETIIQVS